MTLSEATAWALRAAKAGDLEELARALHARGAAAVDGDPPTREVIEAGEQIRSEIDSLKRKASVESARLRRIQEFGSLGEFGRHSEFGPPGAPH